METSKQNEFKITPKIKRAIIEIVDGRLKETQIIRKDISELKDVVKELAEAQKRTEHRVEELAEAQKRTEQRVDELAEVQRKSEERLNRVELAIEKLTEAQRRTEEELRNLVEEHRETRSLLGGLSTTVVYRLEDEAFKSLPELLKRDYGMIIQERLKRQYIKDRTGFPLEVNIFGEALRNEKKITIIGEAKSQLSKKGVDEFIRKKLDNIKGLFEETFPILVTYMISEPDAEEYAKRKGITIYYSYDF